MGPGPEDLTGGGGGSTEDSWDTAVLAPGGGGTSEARRNIGFWRGKISKGAHFVWGHSARERSRGPQTPSHGRDFFKMWV